MQQLKQSEQQQQRHLLELSHDSAPSTSCQITSTSPDTDKRLIDLTTPPTINSNKRHTQQQQTLESPGRHNKSESQSLLASSGYRSQASVEFSRSSNDRTSAPGESRHLIEKPSLCGCCRTSNSSNRSIMSNSSRLVLSYFLAEMLGTFFLVLIGDGSIAAYVVMKHPVDVFNACFAFGVGAMIATYLAAKISGAHLNPAATLAMALDGKLKWRLVPVYMLAQYLGGFLAALMLYVNYIEAISAIDGGSRSAFGGTNSTGNIFATYPSEWVSVWGSLLDQIVGTATLLFTLSAVTDKNNGALDERFQPVVIAFVIGLVCFAFSPNCGAIFNPARDLAPRILTWLVGYSSDVWAPINGYYWLTAGLVGPHMGAILGYFGYKLLISSSLDSKRQYELEQNQCESIHPMNGGGGTLADSAKMPSAKLVQISHHNHQFHKQQQQQQNSTAADTNYGSAQR